MQENGYGKQYFLDYSNHLELCSTVAPGQELVLVEKPVGAGMCALLNLKQEQLEKLRAQLGKMLPMNSRDPDAYMVMLSVKLGSTPLPDSEYAAKLFELLGEIAELDDLFYMAMQIDRLFNQFEENAPEKEIIKWMAAVTAWAGAALDTAVELLPIYRARVDTVLNHTLLDERGGQAQPVLSRAFAYQSTSQDAVLHLKQPVLYRVFSRCGQVLSGVSEQDEPQDEVSLFFGDSMQGRSMEEILRLLFQQMLMADAVVRVCGVCGRYFIPAVRSNEKYCDFASPEPDGSLLTCKQRSTRIRLETDASLKLLKGAYDKNFIKSGRKADATYRERVFRPWYAWAKLQRQQYLNEEISLELLAERLQIAMEDYLTDANLPE